MCWESLLGTFIGEVDYISGFNHQPFGIIVGCPGPLAFSTPTITRRKITAVYCARTAYLGGAAERHRRHARCMSARQATAG